jgi:hypothetical protein
VSMIVSVIAMIMSGLLIITCTLIPTLQSKWRRLLLYLSVCDFLQGLYYVLEFAGGDQLGMTTPYVQATVPRTLHPHPPCIHPHHPPRVLSFFSVCVRGAGTALAPRFWACSARAPASCGPPACPTTSGTQPNPSPPT